MLCSNSCGTTWISEQEVVNTLRFHQILDFVHDCQPDGARWFFPDCRPGAHLGS